MVRKKETDDSIAENAKTVTKTTATEQSAAEPAKKTAGPVKKPEPAKQAVTSAAPVSEAVQTEAASIDAEACAVQESADSSADTLANVIDEAQEIAANGIVKNHIIASIALGLVPVPLFDLAALTAAQMSMLRNLSEHYGVSFEESNSKALLTSLVGGSLPVLGAVGFSSLIKLIPGIGTLGGSASLSIVAGAVTYAIGQTFIMHFEKGGTFEDFDPKQAREFFQREVDSGKAFVQNMRDELNELKASKQQAEQGAEETAEVPAPETAKA